MFNLKYVLVLLLISGIIISGGIFFVLSNQDVEKNVVFIKVWEKEKNILHLPLYVAMQEGYFAEQGIKVQLLNGSDLAAKDLYAGDLADILLTDPVDCIYHQSVNQSAPLIVASLAHRDGTFILAREKETISWEGLRNKNIICYPPETGPGLVMEKIIRNNGMVPMRDLCLYNRIPDELRLGVFKSGSGSYIQLSGTQALIAEENGAGHIIASLGESANSFPSVLCTVKPEVISTRTDSVQGFVNGIYKAQLWMQHEPQITARAIKTHLGDLDQKILNQILQKYLTMKMWTPDPQIDEQTFNDIKQLMLTTGQLDVPVTYTYETAVNNSYACQAVKTIQYTPKDEQGKSWFREIFD
ncbi:NMT1/THI5 like protein [Sporotomaculum syntrophicum]|uniref:Thiamine pyrimidine synthase n=1 Tax=Sporotomaculum syntrophicum TaxID=182264 RepID=A0A9D2WRL7_9FIRM|nr:ABC transporter substrate-binding protein [Sporotomaculum syntrophicum]KAF1085641.1 NMT1/THI5 like protein [Sporotomaculum syntrophicum]